MKKKSKKIVVLSIGGLFSIILILCSIYVYLNIPRSAEEFQMGADMPDKKVLIATQGSDFKNSFVQKLCDSLKSPDTYIQGIGISNLKTVNPNNWDHIIIINSFIVNLNRKVNRFLERIDNTDNVLLFVTAGGADWVPKDDLSVDALTSASRLEYSDDLISLIHDWFNSPLQRSWEPNDYLAALKYFSQVDVQKACNKIKTDRSKYEYIYPKLESRINLVGYYFMRLEKFENARQVLKMNIDFFPENSNVYDSYGEACYRMGDISEAIKYYDKALELNPESESAKTMLSKLIE